MSSGAGLAKEVIGGIGGIVDDVWTSKEEILAADLREKRLALEPHLGQIETNKIEAAHGSKFVAGWRPAVGWVIAIALFYAFILEPLLGWGFALWAPGVVPPPKVDALQLITLLSAMLGLAGSRTFEKMRGVARLSIQKPSPVIRRDVQQYIADASYEQTYRVQPASYVPVVEPRPVE